MQALVLDLLALLLHHRGRVVSEDVLRRELWHGVHVADASLRRLLKEARRAIGDDGAKQAQIKTFRGRGVSFAGSVTTEDGWDTSFVGRKDLLQALEQTLEAALDGLGGVTLLSGAAGIGKSRALLELGARAELRRVRVLRGSGRAGAEGDAFHPWLDIAAELGIEEILRQTNQPAVRAARREDADAQRTARFRGVAQAVAAAARERPLLIALDDLQFADADSLALLRFIAPSLRAARAWVVGSFRTGSGAAEGRLRELAALGAETSSQVLALRGMAADELREVVRNSLHVEVAASVSELLSARTDGNPLFALEIARSVHGDGRALDDALAPELDRQLATRIEPLLARRLGALTPASARLLRAAAAIGIEFDPALLREAEGPSAGALARALAEATAAGLLDPPAEARRRFAHPLFVEALYGELVARGDEVAAQHLRIAEALERRGSVDAFLLARHFTASRPVVSAERVWPYARAAAEEAWRRSALADAELWYRRAVTVAEEAAVPAQELVDLLLRTGEVVVASSGIVAAREFFEHAARLAAASEDPELLARAALAYAHRPNAISVLAPVLHWLRAADAARVADVSLRARVLSRLGAELAYGGAEHAEEAAARLEQGLALARQHGDAFTLGRVLVDQTALRFSARDTRGWITLAEEIVRCTRAARDPELEFRGLVACAAGHLEIGDRSAAEAVLAACQQFSGEHPSQYALCVTAGIEAMFASLDGRFADARAALATCEAHISGSRGLAALLYAPRFVLAREERAGLEEVVRGFELGRAQFPAAAFPSAAAGVGYALLGRVEPARGALEEVIERLPTLRHDWMRLPTLVLAGELAFRARVPEAAQALQPELAPYVELGAVSLNVWAYLGSVAQALGWLAAASGRRREAVGLFERALRAHEALRSPAWCARSASAIAEVRGLSSVSLAS